MYVIHKDELYHFGIKGQKWGVRRFQNPDGTYTAEGRERYGRYPWGSGSDSNNKKGAGSSSKPVLTARQKKKYSEDAIYKSLERQDVATKSNMRLKPIKAATSARELAYRKKGAKLSYKISRAELKLDSDPSLAKKTSKLYKKNLRVNKKIVKWAALSAKAQKKIAANEEILSKETKYIQEATELLGKEYVDSLINEYWS